MLVADDDRVTPRQASRDRRVALQQCCGFNGEVVVAIGVVPSPGRGVRRKTDTGVVRIGELGNKAVDCADLNVNTEAPGPPMKDRACGVGVRENKQPAGTDRVRNIARIGGTLIGLAAPARRFDGNQRCVGPQRCVNAGIAHRGRSRRSARPTAFRTPFRNGRKRSLNWGHSPNAKNFPASSRPP